MIPQGHIAVKIKSKLKSKSSNDSLGDVKATKRAKIAAANKCETCASTRASLDKKVIEVAELNSTIADMKSSLDVKRRLMDDNEKKMANMEKEILMLKSEIL